MNATLEQPPAPIENGTPLVRYSPTEAQIAEWRERFSALPATVSTPDGYEACRKAIAVTRNARVAIEKKRVELKADALAYGRRVDSEAKRLTGMIEAVEEPLKAAKQTIDDEAARVKREAEEKERARLAAIEQAKRDAEEVERKRAWAAREAELLAQRQADEEKNRVERARLAELQKKVDDERKANEAAQAAAQAKLEKQRREDDERRLAERRRADQEAEAHRQSMRKQQEEIDRKARAVQAEKDAIERAKLAKAAAEQAAAEAKERVEREAREAKERAERDAAAAEAERVRIEALRPDVEKIHAFGEKLRTPDYPAVTTDDGAAFMLSIVPDLVAIADRCLAFGGEAAQ